MRRSAQHMNGRRARLVRAGVLIALWALSGHGAAALDVGTVVEATGKTDLGRSGAWTPAALNQAITVGDSLRTGASGSANLAFFDRAVTAAVEGAESAALVSSLTVHERSLVSVEKYEFDPRGPDAQFRLRRGRASALVGKTGAGYAIETPTAVALAKGTIFVVTYDEAAESTEVVGVAGRVSVAALDQEVWVDAQQITTIRKGEAPDPPQPLDEQRFRQYLEGLQFVGGGRPESLALHGPWLQGTDVPRLERLVVGVLLPPDPLDPCPRISAPTCATQQPLSGVGSVDIEF